MSVYSRAIELLQQENAKRVRQLIGPGKEYLMKYLKAGLDDDEMNPNYHPDSADALDATMEEEEMMESALSTWKRLTEDEREQLVKLVEKLDDDASWNLEREMNDRLPLW